MPNKQFPADNPAKGKAIKTFDLNMFGLTDFYKTLTAGAYVMAEATMTAFSFIRPLRERVKEAVTANTYELKQASLARRGTDKTGAGKLCRILKAQALSVERLVTPAVTPPEKTQALRSLFTACGLYRKQGVMLENRIHSLLKERLHGFTEGEISGRKRGERIRSISPGTVMRFQVNQLMGRLDRDEGGVEALDCWKLRSSRRR